MLDSIVRVQDSFQVFRQDSFFSSGPYEINEISESEWMASGLTRSDSRRLMNYLASGGKIFNPYSFARINIGDSLWRNKVTERLILEKKTRTVSGFSSFDRNSAWRNSLLIRKIDIHNPDSSALLESGIPHYIITRWRKYVRRGARFDSVAQVLTIWGMDTTWYELNADSLIIEQTSRERSEGRSLILYANQLGVDELSEVLSYKWQREKWLEYRDRLGGYVNTSQFWECGIDSNSIMKLMNHEWKFEGERRFDLNTSTLQLMSRHPYIGWRRAKTVEYYRTRVRPIEDPEVLIGLDGWTKEDVERLREYLK
ncbi:MAG: hypothetical protein HWE14_12950 [Flavobacteriia bacterium]|nr:hypothetical protein [Flavobacteriia bacterium]